jgi:hypothetical protein
VIFWVFVIPPFSLNGNLPPGIHEATWQEIQERFGWNAERRSLLEGLRKGLLILKEAGSQAAYINGSFVTTKDKPNDFDVYWLPYDVDFVKLKELEPAFLTASRGGRKKQKEIYGGEFFFSKGMLKLFQETREKTAKGIIALDLRRLT